MSEMPNRDEAEEDEIREPRRDAEVDVRGFSRGATDLVVSLAANGRSVRLFTADGDSGRSHFPTDGIVGLDTNGKDR